ncbi:hypothetical protein DV515_00008090, partial [Chloebia gouldiae]
ARRGAGGAEAVRGCAVPGAVPAGGRAALPPCRPRVAAPQRPGHLLIILLRGRGIDPSIPHARPEVREPCKFANPALPLHLPPAAFGPPFPFGRGLGPVRGPRRGGGWSGAAERLGPNLDSAISRPQHLRSTTYPWSPARSQCAADLVHESPNKLRDGTNSLIFGDKLCCMRWAERHALDLLPVNSKIR